MKILVVDDEKIKRVTLADDLATQGHEVVTAADGQEALDKLAARTVRRGRDRSENAQARRDRTVEADQARSAGRHRSHHDDRLRQHSRGRRGRQARGVRFSDEAVPQRGRFSPVGADRTTARGGRAAPRGALLAGRGGCRDRRPVGRHGPRQTDGRNLREDRRQRVALRRDGRGQGPAGHHDPSQLAPPRVSFRQSGLHAACAPN